MMGPVAIVVVATAIVACATTPKPDPGETLAVESTMQRYARALRTTNPDSVLPFFEPDGELVEPGMAALHGHSEIRAFLAPFVGKVEVDSVTVRTDSLHLRGDSASQWGIYRQIAGEPGKPKTTFAGHYAATWHRDADREWRFERLVMTPEP
jgi:uncharacterized protein (TIGR02246 family)